MGWRRRTDVARRAGHAREDGHGRPLSNDKRFGLARQQERQTLDLMIEKGVSRTWKEGVLDTRMKGLEIAVSRLFFVLVRSCHVFSSSS